MTKGESSYEISSIVDYQALEDNLDILNSISQEAKEIAQAKSRELAKSYHARRKSFLVEMPLEDVICGMILFPQVMVFLLLLSVVTHAARHIDSPKDENELKERMQEIWKEANAGVQREVKQIQEEILNARFAGSNKTDITVAEKAGRGLREENGSGQSSVREMGTETNITVGRDARTIRRDEKDSVTATLETANTN